MSDSQALLRSSNLAIGRQSWAVHVFLVAIGVLIIATSAKIKVPMWPVEMSLQTLAIFLIAGTYGSRLGVATVVSYLVVGAAGFPVFQSTPERGIGLAYMVGPTAGYLAGFVVMTYIVGRAADLGWWRSTLKIGCAMLVGEVVLLLLGFLWLVWLFGAQQAFVYGIGPFIIPDLLKVALAACLVSVLPKVASLRRR